MGSLRALARGLLVAALARGLAAAAGIPVPFPEAPDSLPIRVRVLAIVYDPRLADGTRLHSRDQERFGCGYYDPRELAEGFVAGVKEASHGSVEYQVVEWIDRDDFPPMKGTRLSEAVYLGERGRSEYVEEISAMVPRFSGWDGDLEALRRKDGLFEAVGGGRIDEVWYFGPTGFGWPEAWMYGRGAFFINGPALDNDQVAPFAVFGFNFERGLGCMLHDLGHRIESTMDRVFGGRDPNPDGNSWQRFSAHELVNPGRAGVGLVHFPPNARKGYDDANPAPVASTAEAWLAYPELPASCASVAASAWGGTQGDCQEGHIRWWLAHLPHAAGRGGLGGKEGTENNWWLYIHRFRVFGRQGQVSASADILVDPPMACTLPPPVATPAGEAPGAPAGDRAPPPPPDPE